MNFTKCSLILLLLVVFDTGCKSASDNARPIIGRVENVIIPDIDAKLKARIDTGAGVSSVHASIIEIIQPSVPGHSQKIIFEISDEKGSNRRFEKKIVDWIDIKRKGSKGYVRRPVVLMNLCIGGQVLKGRVNLADRGNFLYPVLVGRNFLKMGNFLIDPHQKFATSSNDFKKCEL